MHIFFVHKVGDNKDIIEDAKKLHGWLKAKHANQRIQITLSLSDWDHYFDGDWDLWANGVINRRNVITRERIYTQYISAKETLGRADYIIMDRALQYMPPCYHWDGDTYTMRIVNSLRVNDESNYQHTGTLLLGPEVTNVAIR